jgi:penicillin-binding protein 1A
MKKQLKKRPQRHSLLTRSKWWLRARWRWFVSLRWWQKTILISGPIFVVALIIPLLTYAYFALTMGDIEHLMNRNNTGVVLKDIHGEVFYSTGNAEHRPLVPLNQISPYVKNALVASEDRNFYQHNGISLLSTLRAVYGYVFSGGGEFGGSTLTQQLAKMTLLSSDRGLLRQYQAFSVALAIESRYSKDEILEMYLNAAYFGNNSFGIEQAAKNYFNKKPADLTLAESAMLIGLLPAPSTYSPITGDAALAAGRQAEVLKRMVRENMITEQQRTVAIADKLSYQPAAVIKNDAPHFTEMALKELYDKYGEEVVERSGYQVTTTLDLSLQRSAVESVAKQMPYIQRMGGSNTGLVAIDPRSGEIRALVGSADYQNPQWGKVNMAITKRQPGSTFKPIYYSAALAEGMITPSTIIKDEPININGYSPHNATRRYYGDVTVRQALSRSLNIPSVKILQKYGVKNAVDTARKLGITTLGDPSQYGLSLAIGSAEVPLEEMTNAYTTFANGGNLHENTTIQSIQDKYSKTTFTHQPTSTQVLSTQGAYLISSILSDANSRSFMFGTSLNVGSKTVAVKTGTTDDNRDAWAIGYTPAIVVGVWVGNNDNTIMKSGGADMAGPIWRSTMATAIGDTNPSFTMPDGIVTRQVCYGTGALALSAGTNTYSEVFLASALPTESCNGVNPKPAEEKKQPEEEKPTTPVENDPTDSTGSGSTGSGNGNSNGTIPPGGGTGNNGNNGSPGGGQSPTPIKPTTPTSPQLR